MIVFVILSPRYPLDVDVFCADEAVTVAVYVPLGVPLGTVRVVPPETVHPLLPGTDTEYVIVPLLTVGAADAMVMVFAVLVWFAGVLASTQ